MIFSHMILFIFYLNFPFYKKGFLYLLMILQGFFFSFSIMVVPRQKLIGGLGFHGSNPIPSEVYSAIFCNGIGPASTQTLNAFGWTGKIIGGITFWLGPNNLSIERGSFFLKGSLLEAPYVVPAKKLWPDAADTISLSLPLTSVDFFTFPDSLTSNYVEDVSIPHSFLFNDANSNLSPSVSDLDNAGIGNFCLRAIAYPSTHIYVKVFILLFPCSLEDLSSHALYSNPKWPGLLIFSGEIPLFPPASSKRLKYGCPLLPLLISNSPSSATTRGPPASEITAKIASILRTGILPETAKTGQHLLLRWLALDDEGARSLNSDPAPTLWPAPRLSSAPPQGKSSFPPPSFFLSLRYLYVTYPS